jgi:hypothetical protein
VGSCMYGVDEVWCYPVSVMIAPTTHRNSAAPLLPPVPFSTLAGWEKIPVPNWSAQSLVLDEAMYQSSC